MVLYQLRTSHSAKWSGSCVQYDRNLYVLSQYLFAWKNWRSERRTKRCQDIGMESASSVIRTTSEQQRTVGSEQALRVATKSIYRDAGVWCKRITNGFNASVLLIGREATKCQITGTSVTVSLPIDQRHRPGLWGISYKNCACLKTTNTNTINERDKFHSARYSKT